MPSTILPFSHTRSVFDIRIRVSIGGDPGEDGGTCPPPPPPPPPPSNFSGGIVPPRFLKAWKLYIHIFAFKHNESNTKRLIQHKNTSKHTKSLYLPRASRADSPNHISAFLALPAISVTRGGGGGLLKFQSFVGTLGNLSVHVSRQACHLYRQPSPAAQKLPIQGGTMRPYCAKPATKISEISNELCNQIFNTEIRTAPETNRADLYYVTLWSWVLYVWWVIFFLSC